MKIVIDLPTNTLKDYLLKDIRNEIKRTVRREIFNEYTIGEIIKIIEGKLDIEDYRDYTKIRNRWKSRDRYLKKKEELNKLPILKRE